jgi:hypothetical protein
MAKKTVTKADKKVLHEKLKQYLSKQNNTQKK